MELQQLREQIDLIDREILECLNTRVQLAARIGRIKESLGAEMYVPSREEAVFRKLAALNQGPLDEKAIRSIYRQIISAALALERQLVIAYLGPEATYTHQAALKNFGASMSYLPCMTVPDIFVAVRRGDADYGVAPVENSTQGTVISTLDMLVEENLKIVAQIYLEIQQCLISLSPLEQIREVHSKDNALGQCRQWLARMLPHATLVECASTSLAVQLAKENPAIAAIASAVASELYGVPVVRDNIQDKADNITRFVVIGRKPTAPLGQGRDKTSIAFTLHSEPGSLLKALRFFSDRQINLVKIESRPSRQKVWDYLFYVDFVGHHDEPQVQEALAELRQNSPMVRWLGSYPDTGW